MNLEPTLRLAEPDDLSKIVALERKAFTDPWSEASWKGTLEFRGNETSAEVAHLAYLENRLAGFAAFRLVLDDAELLRLAVDPATRRCGLGRRLLSHGLAHAIGAGAQRCHLEVESNNRAALALYHRFGFVTVGRRPGYYGRGTGDSGRDALLLSLEPIRLPQDFH